MKCSGNTSSNILTFESFQTKWIFVVKHQRIDPMDTYNKVLCQYLCVHKLFKFFNYFVILCVADKNIIISHTKSKFLLSFQLNDIMIWIYEKEV